MGNTFEYPYNALRKKRKRIFPMSNKPVNTQLEDLMTAAPPAAIPNIISVLRAQLCSRLETLPGTIAWPLADALGSDLFRYGMDIRSPDTKAYWNRYAPARALQSFKILWDKVQFPSWEGKNILDLGAGEYVPASLALLGIAHGVKKAYAVEPCESNDMERTFMAYEDLIKEILYAPEKYIMTQKQERIDFLSVDVVQKIKARQVTVHQAKEFVLFQKPIAEIPLCEEPIDIVWGFSVLEHIANLDEACAVLSQMVQPGGKMLFTVDFTDHRRYVDASINPWEFLCDKEYAGDLNRLRYGAIRKCMEKHGFEVLEYSVQLSQAIPSDIKERLCEEFKVLSDEELSILNAHLVVERKKIMYPQCSEPTL